MVDRFSAGVTKVQQWQPSSAEPHSNYVKLSLLQIVATANDIHRVGMDAGRIWSRP